MLTGMRYGRSVMGGEGRHVSGKRSKLLMSSPHSFAGMLYLLVVGVVPVVFMAVFGFGQMAVWSSAGAPHPWGWECAPFFLFIAVPWLMAVALFGMVFLTLTAVCGLVKRSAGMPVWLPVPLVLALILALARDFSTEGIFMALLISLGFTVYWLAFALHEKIQARGGWRVAAEALGFMFVVGIVAFGVLSLSREKARVVAARALADDTYRCVRSSLIIRADFQRTMWCQACWGFRYENRSALVRMRRIYVSLPEYELFDYRAELKESPLFGVPP